MSTGTAAVGNGDGLFLAELDSTNWIGVNTVYGAESPDQENVISGNELGLEFYDCTANVVAGNLIGTNASGSAAVANMYGVLFDGTGSFNLLGTSGQDGSNDALERNVISGNTDVGVVVGSIVPTGLTQGTVTGNVVAGNFIGTNAAGTAAVANGTGVEIITDFDAATANFVGVNSLFGPEDSDQRNVISGNSGNGLIIEAGASDNIVAGNYIGLNASGTAAVGNHQAGVLLATGASDNTIGGLTALLRNVIGGNLNRGVFISTPAGSSRADDRKRDRGQLYRHRCLRTVADHGQHKRRDLDRPLAGQHHRRNGGRRGQCDGYRRRHGNLHLRRLRTRAVRLRGRQL